MDKKGENLEDSVRVLLQERFEPCVASDGSEQIQVLEHWVVGDQYEGTSSFALKFSKRRPDNGDWVSVDGKFFLRDVNDGVAYARTVRNLRSQLTATIEYERAMTCRQHLETWHTVLEQHKTSQTIRRIG